MMRLIAENALELDARGRVCVPHLSRKALLEIRRIREQLEGGSAYEAATNASSEAIDELANIHATMISNQERGNFSEAIGCNTQFHLKLCEIAELPITLELVFNLWMRCGPLLSHLYDAGVPPNWDPHPHERIIAALRTGDGEAAREALTFDIRGNGAGLLAHVRGEP